MFDTNKVDRIVEMFAFDIYIAILKIEDTASGFDNVQDLLYSYHHWDSVMREFEIIGEASKYLLKSNLLDKKYQKVVDFRNIITHEYFGIEPNEIWNVIYNNLESFKKVILELINDINQPLKEELIDAFIEDTKYLDFIVNALIELKQKRNRL